MNLNKILRQAIRYEHIPVIKRVIELGANVNAKDNDGWTPLIYASRYGYTEIVKLLEKWGKNEPK